jgi:hypothetical protein
VLPLIWVNVTPRGVTAEKAIVSQTHTGDGPPCHHGQTAAH